MRHLIDHVPFFQFNFNKRLNTRYEFLIIIYYIMKYLLSKDRKKRSNFEKLEKNRLMFRFFSRNRILFCSSFSKLFLAESKKKKMIFGKRFPKISYLSRIRNICLITGQTHSVYSEFRLSRMCLKEAFNEGLFPGIKKSSWLKFNLL
jgi:ribosomal protein S14